MRTNPRDATIEVIVLSSRNDDELKIAVAEVSDFHRIRQRYCNATKAWMMMSQIIAVGRYCQKINVV